ncbi:hypothetical protein OG595_12630 [Streptomyces sp. NBC_01451]
MGPRRPGVRQSERSVHPAAAGRRTRSRPGDRDPATHRPTGVDPGVTAQTFVTMRARMIS